MRHLLLLLAALAATPAFGLSTWTAWVTAQPYVSKQVPVAAMIARGIGTDAYYVLEVDPVTGNLPVSASLALTAESTPGAAVPSKALYVAGTDGANLRGLKTDSSGELQVDVLSSALPSGAATAALQTTGNDQLASINNATSNVDTKTPALGQTTMAGSSPVTIASNQTALSVTSTNFPTTLDTNTGAAGASTLRVVQSTRSEAAATPLSVRLSMGGGFNAANVPIFTQGTNGTAIDAYGSGADGSTVPRSTLSTRHEDPSTPVSVRITSGSSFNAANVPFFTQGTNGTSINAFGSGADGSTVPRSTLSTRHETVSTPLAAQLSNGTTAITYGAGASTSASPRVVISTDSPAPAGRAYADSARNAYSSTNVTTGAWVQIDASTAAAINALTVFDSCGQTLELGTGAAAAETRVLIVTPGGFDGILPLAIAAGTRLSLRAISGNCTTGEFNYTGFQ